MRWLFMVLSFNVFGQSWHIHLQQIPLRYFLQSLADIRGENIVISQNVQGKIDVALDDVEWVQIAEFLQKTQHLSFQQSGGILWVDKAYQVLPADKNHIAPPPLEQYWYLLKNTEVKALSLQLQDKNNGLLSPFGKLIIDEKTNSFWVMDLHENILALKSFIARIDKPSQQVEIRARIVNMNQQEAKDLGVRLAIHTPQQEETPNVDLAAIPMGANPVSFAMVLASFGDRFIDAQLSALEGRGRAKVIASPRLVTSNQQEASIASGEDIPYQETSLNGATSVSFKKALLKLKVKPYILTQGRMILEIEINQDADSGRRVQGVPIISTKSMHTKVILKSSETLVLGGIATYDIHQEKMGLPIIKDIPIVGYLFSRLQKRCLNEELVLMLTPRLI